MCQLLVNKQVAAMVEQPDNKADTAQRGKALMGGSEGQEESQRKLS